MTGFFFVYYSGMSTPYHANLFAHELTLRRTASNVENLIPTLMGARVDLNPHQIDAALFAFRSPLSKGAILADEVGLGKTIEAGIVLAQKWAERKRAICIITPASLRSQWQQELWEKFSLPSVILDKQLFESVQNTGHSNPFSTETIVIASYDFARRKADLLRLLAWDLVVIDEAHRLRNVYKKNNTVAKELQRALIDAPKLLLTATPLQNSLNELYGLVSFIDPHIFSDIKTFRAQYVRPGALDDSGFADLKARLAPVCKRTLRRQVLEYVRYTERRAHTQDFTLSPEEENLYQGVSAYLQQEKLWALPSGQRSLMVLVLRKLLASSSYAIAGALKTMLERLNFILHNYAAWKNGDTPGNPILDDFEGAELTLEEEPALYGLPGQTIPLPHEEKAIRDEILALRTMLFNAESITDNAKGKALLQALATGLGMTQELGGAAKAIIFTESRRTQKYLYELLNQNGYAGQVLLFNGSNSDRRTTDIYTTWKARHQSTGSRDVDVRAALVEEFRDRASIMIATEAASEGVNLQFCSLVINYDLPWNPQRVEQRIGRCHRYGQKHDVVVVNFLNRNNAADRRVFEILSEKFKLFSGVFGASDEVLGSIESGVDFEKRIAEIYQTCRTQDAIQASFDALQASLSQDIEEGLSTARQKLLEHFDSEVAEKLQVYKAEVAAGLDRAERLLWELAMAVLADSRQATFNEAQLAFTLASPPVRTLSAGRYALKPCKQGEHFHCGHPLAVWMLEHAKTAPLPAAELEFNLTSSGKNIAVLEPFKGQGGFLAVSCLSLTALEVEEYMLYAGCTDAGEALDAELTRRLFELPAHMNPLQHSCGLPASLQQALAAQQSAILATASERNAAFFEEEMDKLERWADERKKHLEYQIEDMDRAIRQQKADARKTASLDAKVAAQRHIKVLETKRYDMRKRLFEAQDSVENRKDDLLNAVEARLRQAVEEKRLFVVRWRVV